jgi:hypothetical protein
MTGYVLASLIFLGGTVTAMTGELVNEEIRGWLDYLPRFILGLAARRLDPAGKITIYEDEWLPELTCILRGAEARPLSRLIIGVKFSVGLLITARRIARHLHRTPPSPAQPGLLPLATASAPGIASPGTRLKLLTERVEEVSMRRASLVAGLRHTSDVLHTVSLLTACQAIAPESWGIRGTQRLDQDAYSAKIEALYHNLAVTEQELGALTRELEQEER